MPGVYYTANCNRPHSSPPVYDTDEVNVTRLSSRGQVVIPREIREKLALEEGARLLVFRISDSVILKSTSEISAEGLTSSLEAIRKKISQLGISRRDVEREIRAARKTKQKAKL